MFLIFINHELHSDNDGIYIQYENYYEMKKPSSALILNHSSAKTASILTNDDDGLNIIPGGGYFNLSCPFEMSKFSCGYMHRGSTSTQQETVLASMDYYRQQLDMIRESFRRVAMMMGGDDHDQNKRILISGDSLMRQLFISIACNAYSIFPHNNLIADAVFPWQDPWPIIFGRNNVPSIGGGVHGGFGAASIRLINGMEIHYVPHRGCNDPTTGEINILERLKQDIDKYDGRITFGMKTAMPVSLEDHVDVFVYQVGIHYGLGESKTILNHFINRVSKPLMKVMGNNDRRNFILHDGYEKHGDNTNNSEMQPQRPRTRIIYVTTPTQHYNTPMGQWEQNMTSQTLKCVDQVESNPRAEQEKKMLKPGVNVDVLLDYDDLSLGSMHVQYGDCSHYCMPGPPDGVAARLMHELLV